MSVSYRRRLLASTLLMGAASVATPAWAQPGQVEEPVVGDAAQVDTTQDGENTITVTGSRIARPNLESNSPIAVVTGEQVVENADVTLETFLNTLPQVNAAATTTSNNPSNGGAATIDLRGLGSNRNLVLVNGRRPMVSSTLQDVDVNTIPQGLIERIDVITGAAGATYGADAIAGVVNIILRDDFEGVDLRATYANTVPETDAREVQLSGTVGGNLADGRGNFAVTIEYADRQGLTKGQRDFARLATATTGSFPTGRFTPVAGNPIPQSAINALFATYGSAAVDIPTESLIGFNADQSLFGIGTFNNPRNVTNFRYPPGSAANENPNFFPDFYTYNFDIINLLVLPLERYSGFMRGHYEIHPAVEVFVQGNYTDYTSATALAPTPIGVTIKAPGENTVRQAFTPLLVPGTGASLSGFIVPVTNPFIPTDLRTLLNARTGDDPRLVGAGANEAFNIGYRFLGTGLREQAFHNRVLQGLAGVRGEITEGWRYEAYYSYGVTDIDASAAGNVDVQKVQQLLQAADGGASICAGGFNPFGVQPLSAECVEFVNETGVTSTTFTQRVAQAFVTGEVAQLPAGALSIVAGVERRSFDYEFDPGTLNGPIAGFNPSAPAGGSNTFMDYFGEVFIPILRDQPWAQQLELTLQARHSTSDFNDVVNDVDGDPVGSWAYGATLTYAPFDALRFRASYQHAVRAPNFGELFSGGGGFPQIFDPCSTQSVFRTSGGATARNLCLGTGLTVNNVDQFVATPGQQAFITFSGNTDLQPEEADTFTVGTVFQAYGFTGSVDYYNIRINDTIRGLDANMLISACYGNFGVNPNLAASNPYCAAVNRSGGNIFGLFNIPAEIGGDALGYFQSVNQGVIQTSGVDVQLGYRLPTEFIAERSALNMNLLVNYLINYEIEELPGVLLDYADTVAYFGAGLGQSFPRWKALFNAALSIDPFTFSTRIRHIDGMTNRLGVQFPDEAAAFTGTDSITYVDAAVEWRIAGLGDMEGPEMSFRLGVNNLFDTDPPQYAPNVQSGTDPSTFDVIGRRFYVSARLRF